MVWKKASAEIAEHLGNAVARFHPEKRKMFGHVAHFINCNMFAGTFGDEIFIRLSVDDRKNLLAECDEAAHFEPIQGRPMREYIVIPESIHGDPQIFEAWLIKSNAYVASLPPKEKKRKK